MRSLTFLIFLPVAVHADEPVDFSRQILPILSNKCFVCHGPASNGDTDLRLDNVDGATADRGGYQAVSQTEPRSSVLLRRIQAD